MLARLGKAGWLPVALNRQKRVVAGGPRGKPPMLRMGASGRWWCGGGAVSLRERFPAGPEGACDVALRDVAINRYTAVVIHRWTAILLAVLMSLQGVVAFGRGAAAAMLCLGGDHHETLCHTPSSQSATRDRMLAAPLAPNDVRPSPADSDALARDCPSVCADSHLRVLPLALPLAVTPFHHPGECGCTDVQIPLPELAPGVRGGNGDLDLVSFEFLVPFVLLLWSPIDAFEARVRAEGGPPSGGGNAHAIAVTHRLSSVRVHRLLI